MMSDEGVECLTKENRKRAESSLAYHCPDAYKLLKSRGLLGSVVSIIMSAQQIGYNGEKLL